MSQFCILRKAFIDRVIDDPQLAALADMFGQWYAWYIAPKRAEPGKIWCAARIYAVSRSSVAEIRKAFAENVVHKPDASAADEVWVEGLPSATGVTPDVSIWEKVLANPLVQRACVQLMLDIEAPTVAEDGGPDLLNKTIVLCGAPAAGALNLKAIWQVGHDPSIGLIFRHADWDLEPNLLNALDAYQNSCAAGRNNSAMKESLDAFGKDWRRLFTSRRDEEQIGWAVRKRIDLPDEHGPASFARKLAGQLLGGATALSLPLLISGPFQFKAVCILGGVYMLWLAAKRAWKRFLKVRTVYRHMRATLGGVYEKTPVYQFIDLSADSTPTLVKSSEEIQSLGARHLCDVSVTTARQYPHTHRVYALGDCTVRIGLLRRTENATFFPPKAVIFAGTRFTDGRRHETNNSTSYRKQIRPSVSARSTSEDGEAEEVLARHRRHVERMIADGAIPVPPPLTPDEFLAVSRQKHEEGRAAWQRQPYSWSDALHQSFRVRRREYLTD